MKLETDIFQAKFIQKFPLYVKHWRKTMSNEINALRPHVGYPSVNTETGCCSFQFLFTMKSYCSFPK